MTVYGSFPASTLNTPDLASMTQVHLDPEHCLQEADLRKQDSTWAGGQDAHVGENACHLIWEPGPMKC